MPSATRCHPPRNVIRHAMPSAHPNTLLSNRRSPTQQNYSNHPNGRCPCPTAPNQQNGSLDPTSHPPQRATHCTHRCQPPLRPAAAPFRRSQRGDRQRGERYSTIRAIAEAPPHDSPPTPMTPTTAEALARQGENRSPRCQPRRRIITHAVRSPARNHPPPTTRPQLPSTITPPPAPPSHPPPRSPTTQYQTPTSPPAPPAEPESPRTPTPPESRTEPSPPPSSTEPPRSTP